jgi:SAM-dependent methyltransferase
MMEAKKKGQAIAYPAIIRILQENLRAGDRVLEIGCGGKQYRPFLLMNCTYSGLDLPQSRWLREPPEIEGPAESIPRADGSFDFIFGVATFYMHSNPIETFRECYRLLVPGGRFVAFDYTRRTLRKLRSRSDEYSHIRTWNFSELREEICAAGFNSNLIKDISYQADYDNHPGPFMLMVRRARRLFRIYNASWMIVSAVKQ